MANGNNSQAVPNLDFEKARQGYAKTEYEREMARRGTLEAKAQFYLTLYTAFLGAVFLSKDLLAGLNKLLTSDTTPGLVKNIMNLSLAVLALGLLITIASVLATFLIRTYLTPRAKNLYTELFDPEKSAIVHAGADAEGELYRSSAEAYALATDQAKRQNDNKAGAVTSASIGVKIAAAALATLLMTTVIQQLYAAPSPDEPQKVVVVTPVPETATPKP